jgi:hypothetical protein
VATPRLAFDFADDNQFGCADDNHDETLRGIPWTIRLRQTMETAPTLQVALERWADVDNTLGINHGIGCAACQRYASIG